MYSTLASIIKFVQPCMAKYRKSHFWLAHPEDVVFKKKVLLQNTQGTIPVPLHYVEIGSKMQNFKPIHPSIGDFLILHGFNSSQAKNLGIFKACFRLFGLSWG